ncbi:MULTISPECIES: adenosylcobinamide-phosphate synthase CbiB [Clostridium]|uniref:adenosylcobinamide-phosphate synthase CbiB n=2 Tax=Clostridiaceae TaxID=31979 RepID=UPI0005FBA452|nr:MULTISPECIES: adenosylcobinamide-phosphate synthase CbiB [Clostridium]KJZ86599.1 Adenosylcobinamide-phosphate synthase [Clostridium sp. IBUN125C]KJZ89706.1 Adenosylcobinamide-phosphate synthase [Clostridium sp. IBUN62F]KJZ96334.1 Adenosylcobinamide-phosphate synthase [Clostridium sp. IBUN22A]MDU3581836.1 adenosylcobinamide-phosphate synthase CbiB [Clostridium butyricum]MDU3595166.1 adenosylcobinamide-phosphate synthase CbiB [Clostridium butyricum]
MELTIGFILDLLIGDPNNPFHPVRGIGLLASKLETIFRKLLKNSLKIAGLIVWMITIVLTFAITYGIIFVCMKINKYLGIIVQGIIIYFCISAKGLVVEGYKVIKYLNEGNIEKSRKQLSYIVGRDTESLDSKGITRAVIETIAENMSDGVIAPILFAGVFGAAGSMAYKAVNTMDSMFGYKNEKYIKFGYFPAKLDDLFNYIPARVTGILIIISSFFLKRDYKNSFKIYKRDRYNHTSPNSAHPEAAMAGALDIQLGGANYYFGKIVEKPVIGDKIKEIEINDVKKTAEILYLSAVMGFILMVIIKFIIYRI